LRHPCVPAGILRPRRRGANGDIVESKVASLADIQLKLRREAQRGCIGGLLAWQPRKQLNLAKGAETLAVGI
jgi:hypothetical protein